MGRQSSRNRTIVVHNKNSSLEIPTILEDPKSINVKSGQTSNLFHEPKIYSASNLPLTSAVFRFKNPAALPSGARLFIGGNFDASLFNESYDADLGQLTVTGTQSINAYKQVLKNISFESPQKLDGNSQHELMLYVVDSDGDRSDPNHLLATIHVNGIFENFQRYMMQNGNKFPFAPPVKSDYLALGIEAETFDQILEEHKIHISSISTVNERLKGKMYDRPDHLVSAILTDQDGDGFRDLFDDQPTDFNLKAADLFPDVINNMTTSLPPGDYLVKASIQMLHGEASRDYFFEIIENQASLFPQEIANHINQLNIANLKAYNVNADPAIYPNPVDSPPIASSISNAIHGAAHITLTLIPEWQAFEDYFNNPSPANAPTPEEYAAIGLIPANLNLMNFLINDWRLDTLEQIQKANKIANYAADDKAPQPKLEDFENLTSLFDNVTASNLDQVLRNLNRITPSTTADFNPVVLNIKKPQISFSKRNISHPLNQPFQNSNAMIDVRAIDYQGQAIPLSTSNFSFSGTVNTNLRGVNPITVEVIDSQGNTNQAERYVIVVGNGQALPDLTLQPNRLNQVFVEGEAAQIITSSDLDLTSNDAIVRARVQLNPKDPDISLSVALNGFNLNQNYDSNTGILEISGQETASTYESVLRSLKLVKLAPFDFENKEQEVAITVFTQNTASETQTIKIHHYSHLGIIRAWSNPNIPTNYKKEPKLNNYDSLNFEIDTADVPSVNSFIKNNPIQSLTDLERLLRLDSDFDNQLDYRDGEPNHFNINADFVLLPEQSGDLSYEKHLFKVEFSVAEPAQDHQFFVHPEDFVSNPHLKDHWPEAIALAFNQYTKTRLPQVYADDSNSPNVRNPSPVADYAANALYGTQSVKISLVTDAWNALLNTAKSNQGSPISDDNLATLGFTNLNDEQKQTLAELIRTGDFEHRDQLVSAVKIIRHAADPDQDFAEPPMPDDYNDIGVADVNHDNLDEVNQGLPTDILDLNELKSEVTDLLGLQEDLAAPVNNAPKFNTPAIIQVLANGVYTSIPTDNFATATSATGQNLTPELIEGSLSLPAGKHTLVWQVTDPDNNLTDRIEQEVHVLPMVEIVPVKHLYKGVTFAIKVHLNGTPASDYPIDIPVVLTGFDTDQIILNEQRTVTIRAGLDGSVPFTVPLNSNINQLKIDIAAQNLDGQRVNNTSDKSSVSLLVEESIQVVNQNNGNISHNIDGKILDADGHLVSKISEDKVTTLSLIAGISHHGPDSFTQNEWSYTKRGNTAPVSLGVTDEDEPFSLQNNPLSVGNYRIFIDSKNYPINDPTNAQSVIHRELRLTVLPNDHRRITNSASHCKQLVVDHDEHLENAGSYVMQSEAGTCLNLGALSLDHGHDDPRIPTTELSASVLPVDTRYQDTYDEAHLFNFIVSGLTDGFATVVLPLAQPAQDGARFRKHGDNGWVYFDENLEPGESFKSAKGDNGYCPPPHDSAYQNGLQAGHQCIELTIKDGGAHDADGRPTPNGLVSDPGFITSPNGTFTTTPATMSKDYYAESSGVFVDVNVCQQFPSIPDCNSVTVQSVNAPPLVTSTIQGTSVNIEFPPWLSGSQTVTFDLVGANGATGTADLTVDLNRLAGEDPSLVADTPSTTTQSSRGRYNSSAMGILLNPFNDGARMATT